MLTSTVGTLTSVTVAPTSRVAFTTTKYLFTIVPARPIPKGGKILITLPSEVTIPNPTFAANSCAFGTRRNLASTGLESSFTCSCTSNTIQVNSGFELNAFSAGGTLSFDIDGIRNPLSLKPSSSFSVVTQTSGSFAIDQLTSGITVTMTSTRPLQDVSITSSTLVNGASNNIQFVINSPSNLENGHKLSIVFPAQITLPTTVTCVGLTNLNAALTCTKSSQTVEITLNFSPSAGLTGGNNFAFRIDSITNPTSTQPTDDFGFTIRDASGKLFL